VVCDNVVIHRSKLVKRWLANAPTLTIQRRVRQVRACFRERTPAQMLATAAPHSSPWLPEGYMQNFKEAAYRATSNSGSGAAVPERRATGPIGIG